MINNISNKPVGLLPVCLFTSNVLEPSSYCEFSIVASMAVRKPNKGCQLFRYWAK